VSLKIIGESVAGKGFDGKVKSGETIRIMTGARVPDGADAVQKVELTEEKDGFVVITEAAKSEQNINLFASEIKSGAKILGKGEIVSEQMIAAIASFGYAKIKVYKRQRDCQDFRNAAKRSDSQFKFDNAESFRRPIRRGGLFAARAR
jgi:molybdopterin molybdotransferase